MYLVRRYALHGGASAYALSITQSRARSVGPDDASSCERVRDRLALADRALIAEA